MIIIIDDTFDTRDNFNEVNYLAEEKYKQICKVYDKPTIKDFKEIIKYLQSDCKLFCNHRSLKLFTDNGSKIMSEDALKTKQSLFQEVASSKIPRIEFGRDMHTNYEAKTIDKNLFYSNLKHFLDFFITSNSIELKILYYGENFHEMEKLTLLDKVMDEIIQVDFSEYRSNQLIKTGLNTLFPNKTADEIIEIWRRKEFSKKEIIQFINENL